MLCFNLIDVAIVTTTESLSRMPFTEIKLQPPTHQRQEAVLELLASMDFKQHSERLASMWAEASSPL